jgi:hypothetical protein
LSADGNVAAAESTGALALQTEMENPGAAASFVLLAEMPLLENSANGLQRARFAARITH